MMMKGKASSLRLVFFGSYSRPALSQSFYMHTTAQRFRASWIRLEKIVVGESELGACEGERRCKMGENNS